MLMNSLLRVNPTLKTVHAARNSLNPAERGLYAPVARRDVLSSQLVKLSEQYSNLENTLASLQVQTLGTYLLQMETDGRYDER